jgi:hypothetical protein
LQVPRHRLVYPRLLIGDAAGNLLWIPGAINVDRSFLMQLGSTATICALLAAKIPQPFEEL